MTELKFLAAFFIGISVGLYLSIIIEAIYARFDPPKD